MVRPVLILVCLTRVVIPFAFLRAVNFQVQRICILTHHPEMRQSCAVPYTCGLDYHLVFPLVSVGWSLPSDPEIPIDIHD